MPQKQYLLPMDVKFLRELEKYKEVKRTTAEVAIGIFFYVCREICQMRNEIFQMAERCAKATGCRPSHDKILIHCAAKDIITASLSPVYWLIDIRQTIRPKWQLFKLYFTLLY